MMKKLLCKCSFFQNFDALQTSKWPPEISSRSYVPKFLSVTRLLSSYRLFLTDNARKVVDFLANFRAQFREIAGGWTQTLYSTHHLGTLFRKNFCASRLPKFSILGISLHRWAEFLFLTNLKNICSLESYDLSKLGNIGFGEQSWVQFL